MIKCEFSALARACLHRRIPTIAQIRASVLTVLAASIRINGQFSIPAARTKLNAHDTAVYVGNSKYQKT